MEVRWSCDKGTVIVVKELGARWKCAGALTKGPFWKSKSSVHGDVRWSCVMLVQELGAFGKCARIVTRTVMVVQELGEYVEVRWSSDEGTVMEVKELGAC